MPWLASLLTRAASPASPDLLLLCRSSATVRAVLRALARHPRTGWRGLHVATLDALLAEAAPPSLARSREPAERDAPLPSGHAWSAELAARPRLREELRERAERLESARALGVQLVGLSPELASLVDTPFARGERVDHVTRLARQDRSELETIAIGFGDGANLDFSFAGSLDAVDRALLTALRATPLTGTGAPDVAARLAPNSLLTHPVPDVAAEARLVAQLVAKQPEALVLVPDATTAARVRVALVRNGLAVADDAPIPLASHALAATLRALLPLFASKGEAPLDHEDLLRLMRSPVLKRGEPKVRARGEEAPPIDAVDAFDATDDEITIEARTGADGQPEPRLLAPRDLHAMLGEMRLVRAPLTAWLDRAKAVEARLRAAEGEWAARKRISAEVLRLRLERLAKHASEGTLGALGRFASELGLRGNDPLGRAMLGALADAHAAAATPEALDEVLERSTSSRAVHDGVTVIQYREYDGRHSPLVVLAGVHDKGLGRVPRPDPFWRQNDLDALGIKGGRDAQRELLALARWAIGRAAAAVAVAPTHDATGRRVAFPVDLLGEVRFDDRYAAGAYGRGLTGEKGEIVLSELADLGRFHEAEAGAKDDDLAIQIDAEWARAGALFRESPAQAGAEKKDVPNPKADALDAFLAYAPPPPPRLLPLLGKLDRSGDERAAAREGFTLSATELGHFSQCLYKAFCATALGLRKRDPVEDEANARDLGTLAHAALETALKGEFLFVPDDQLEIARARILDKLQKGTREELAKFVKELGLTKGDALHTAASAQAERWAANWSRWLDGRLRAVSDVREERNAEIVKAAKSWPERNAIWEALRAGADVAKKALDDGLAASIRAALESGTLPADLPLLIAEIAPKKQGPASAVLAQAAQQAHLAGLRDRMDEARLRTAVNDAGDAKVVRTELAFGDMKHRDDTIKIGPLSLGELQVKTRGSIDAVLAHVAGAAASYEVVDFKTGRSAGKLHEILGTLTSPQLAFYALVLSAIGATEGSDLEARETRRLTYDLIRGKPTEAEAESGDLDRARQTFGALLARALDGDYSLSPHPLGCPHERSGYCDYQELCRHRGTPEAPEETEQPGQEVAS
jgi:hypothetical protein